jgi:hypothetical protein
MKIRPVAAELFHGDGQTNMTKLTVTFTTCANVANKGIPLLQILLRSEKNEKGQLINMCDTLLDFVCNL